MSRLRLTVRAGAREEDVEVDGARPLADLVPALLLAVGAGGCAAVAEGARCLDHRGLEDQGILNGAVLVLLPPWP